jgi:hypothetical protein
LIRILYQGSTFTGSGTDYDYLVITLQADPGFDPLVWFRTCGLVRNGLHGHGRCCVQFRL